MTMSQTPLKCPPSNKHGVAPTHPSCFLVLVELVWYRTCGSLAVAKLLTQDGFGWILMILSNCSHSSLLIKTPPHSSRIMATFILVTILARQLLYSLSFKDRLSHRNSTNHSKTTVLEDVLHNPDSQHETTESLGVITYP